MQVAKVPCWGQDNSKASQSGVSGLDEETGQNKFSTISRRVNSEPWCQFRPIGALRGRLQTSL